MTNKVKEGDYVKVHYTGKFNDGQIFDSSQGSQPLEVHMGANEVIPGFENALMGMEENEKKSFTVEADKAYGQRDESLERQFNRADFPQDFQPEVGQVLVLQDPSQGQFPATVKDVSGDTVMLDLNHPLAGRTLSFDVQVVEINNEPGASSCGGGCACS